MQSRKLTTPLLVAVLLALSTAASAASFNKSTNPPAQNKDTLSGKYEGVAKSDQLGDIPLTVEIKNDNGKLTGKIDTPQGPAAITSGTFDNGKIVMKFDAGGQEGTVTAMLEGDKISGKWEVAGLGGGGLELKRAAMGASAPAAKPAAGGDPVSGEWECSADANGSAIPFTLKIKLEGDKITGTSDGGQGSTPITTGSYAAAAGKMTFSFDVGGTIVKMSGIIKDGKVIGEYDFGGQVGKWDGKKK